MIECAMQTPVPWSILETWFLQGTSFMADCESNHLAHNDLKPVSTLTASGHGAFSLMCTDCAMACGTSGCAETLHPCCGMNPPGVAVAEN